MGDLRADGAALSAEFGEAITAIRERSDRARAVLRDATMSASHPQLPVTVTVDASGASAALRFGGCATGLDAGAVAHAVLDTSRRARLDAAVEPAAVVSPRAQRFVRGLDEDHDEDDAFAGQGVQPWR